jgi:hypothetical protein
MILRIDYFSSLMKSRLEGKPLRRVLPVFYLILLLAGCIIDCSQHKIPLEEQIFRDARTEEELEVIEFMEDMDLLEFLNLNENDERIFPGFNDYTGTTKFIPNISKFLDNTRAHYNQSTKTRTGRLIYYIICQNLSSWEGANCLVTLYNSTKTNYSQYILYGPPFSLTAFRPLNSTEVIITDTPVYDIKFTDIMTQTLETGWVWALLVILLYDWSGCGNSYSGYVFTEVIFLAPNSQIRSLFVNYALWVA